MRRRDPSDERDGSADCMARPKQGSPSAPRPLIVEHLDRVTRVPKLARIVAGMVNSNAEDVNAAGLEETLRLLASRPGPVDAAQS